MMEDDLMDLWRRSMGGADGVAIGTQQQRIGLVRDSQTATAKQRPLQYHKCGAAVPETATPRDSGENPLTPERDGKIED
jgi:hypothetical protein